MFTDVQQRVVVPAAKISFILLLVIALQGTVFPEVSGVTLD